MISDVYIGLGSNLGDSKYLLEKALETLNGHDSVRLDACSSLYQSVPMGPHDQPDYLNAVCRISTSLNPQELLGLCQNIEIEYGRDRSGERWGARTLDLDLLLFSDQSIDSDTLTIPHPGMAGREFVLVPLFELNPTLIMPDGKPLAIWVANCSLDGLKRLR